MNKEMPEKMPNEMPSIDLTADERKAIFLEAKKDSKTPEETLQKLDTLVEKALLEKRSLAEKARIQDIGKEHGL